MYISNLNTFADLVDRLIVEVNKLAFFDNAKRVESLKPDPDLRLIADLDRKGRDCNEFRSQLKNKINEMLEELIRVREYEVLKEVRTFTPPSRTVGELLAEMSYERSALRDELARTMGYELSR